MNAFWRALAKNRLALVGGAIVLVLAIMAVAAPLVSPHDPHKVDIKRILEPPSARHWLGTDQVGRDVLSRMLYGARVSLAVGFVSVGIATAIGIALGAAAGYHGGAVDAAVMRLVDLMLVFPRFFLLLAVLAFLKPSIWTIMAVIGVTGWMGVARLVRAEFLTLKEREFVIWTESAGAGGMRIVFRHILPHILPLAVVYGALGVAASVLFETTLSFLGSGVQSPDFTWGTMLADHISYYRSDPRLVVLPGLAVTFTVLGFTLLGDSLRDALDPRARPGRLG